jgi:ABC-type multidrug transport system fused ATPase/permease subunit
VESPLGRIPRLSTLSTIGKTMNPFSSGSEQGSAQPVVVRPTSVPRVLGIMSIVFAVLLLLLAFFSLAQALMGPFFATMSQTTNASINKRLDQKQKTELEALEAEEAAAETEEEKELIRQKKDQIQSAPRLFTPDVSKMMPTSNPKVMIYTLVDASVGLLLNLLLLGAGIGLLQYREWGRKLTLWTSSAKLLAGSLSTAYYVVAVTPIIAQMMSEWMHDMAAQQGNPPPPGMQMGMAMMYSAWGIILWIFGSIYPIVCLWMLTRPNVRLSCQYRAAPPIASGGVSSVGDSAT